MLSAKPWKADAIIRLVLSVIICVYAGSLLVSARHYASAGGKVTPKLFFPLAGVALGCLAATLVSDRQTLAAGGSVLAAGGAGAVRLRRLVSGRVGAAVFGDGSSRGFHLADGRGHVEFSGRRVWS